MVLLLKGEFTHVAKMIPIPFDFYCLAIFISLLKQFPKTFPSPEWIPTSTETIQRTATQVPASTEKLIQPEDPCVPTLSESVTVTAWLGQIALQTIRGQLHHQTRDL